MQDKCTDERKKFEKLKREAKKANGATGANLYHQAQTMEMPSCDRIEALRRGETVS